jgi:hypothetical protein
MHHSLPKVWSHIRAKLEPVSIKGTASAVPQPLPKEQRL